MPDIPELAIEAAADAIMSAGNFNDDEPERFEARTLARAALEAASPLLADEAPKVRERARYWSEAVVPLRDVAEEIEETLEGFPANDPVILREMLAKARDVITRCVG